MNMPSRVLSGIPVILLILLQINAQEKSPSCGRRFPEFTPLITNGNPSNEHWPWHAAIYHVGRSPRDVVPQYQCGGTLIIDEITVLTAAHCVCKYSQPLNVENVLVVLGKLDLSEISNSDFLKARKIIPHSNYSHKNLRNDIAIIKLSVQVTFDNHIQPICLWDSNKSKLAEVVGKVGTVVGYGKTETGRLSDTLQQANMPVEDSLVCLERNPDFYGHFVSTRTFCAGFLNGTSACNGDSGGSMTFEENGVYYIRGVLSLTKKYDINETICDPKEYIVFTDVAKYLTWIIEATFENRSGFQSQILFNIAAARNDIVENANYVQISDYVQPLFGLAFACLCVVWLCFLYSIVKGKLYLLRHRVGIKRASENIVPVGHISASQVPQKSKALRHHSI